MTSCYTGGLRLKDLIKSWAIRLGCYSLLISYGIQGTIDKMYNSQNKGINLVILLLVRCIEYENFTKGIMTVRLPVCPRTLFVSLFACLFGTRQLNCVVLSTENSHWVS